MAEYHYKFQGGRPVSGGTTDAKTGADPKGSRSAAPKPPGASYRYSATPKAKEAPNAKETAKARGRTDAASRVLNSRSPGVLYLVGGSILSGSFAIPFLVSLIQLLAQVAQGGGQVVQLLIPVVVLACFFVPGLVLLGMGLSKRRKYRRYKKYLALLGQEDTADLSALAKATGHSHRKVCADLQDMLNSGVLPTGYLDLSRDSLILSDKGLFQNTPAPPVEQEEPQGDEATLAEIRAVNDSIPDPEMTAKIARIEEITGKILEYQRTNPDKASQLRSFLSYYLPTTLKILRAYAQLDRQGVEGENISAAKARIEGMMDKVVEGFEKQLDKLFENTAMDITSDVVVLERMLDKDGLSSGGMTLGG